VPDLFYGRNHIKSRCGDFVVVLLKALIRKLSWGSTRLDL
jgi:hypothetical protein